MACPRPHSRPEQAGSRHGEGDTHSGARGTRSKRCPNSPSSGTPCACAFGPSGPRPVFFPFPAGLLTVRGVSSEIQRKQPRRHPRVGGCSRSIAIPRPSPKQPHSGKTPGSGLKSLMPTGYCEGYPSTGRSEDLMFQPQSRADAPTGAHRGLRITGTPLTWLAKSRWHTVWSSGSFMMARITCSIGVMPAKQQPAQH